MFCFTLINVCLSLPLILLLIITFQSLKAEHLRTLKMEAVFSSERMYPSTELLAQSVTINNTVGIEGRIEMS